MSLYENWRDILKRAWSVRFIVLAAVLSGVEVALPSLQPLFSTRIPPGTFAAMSGIVSAAALFARVVAQDGM